MFGAAEIVLQKPVSMNDDSHKRWNDESPLNQFVWNYFNNTIVKKIISEALHETDITLSDLYQRLSIARAKCEWIKDHLKRNKIKIISEPIINELLTNIVIDFPRHFAQFQFGKTIENNIFDEKGNWGENVAQFSKKRFINTRTGSGLSQSITCMGIGIEHPAGAVLVKLEADFKKLCCTSNLFEFFECSSRLMFMLSNFSPVERGSAAVNTWIIDNIGQERFCFKKSIRPHLYDWAAFFETAEQYTTFYIISAAIAYIESLNIIPKIDDLFIRLWGVMDDNPNDFVVLMNRKNLWLDIKTLLIETLQNKHDLNYFEVNRLKELISGNLKFHGVSEQSIKIENIITSYFGQNPINGHTAIELLTIKDKLYLKELLELKWNISKKYLAAFGTQDEESRINKLWRDCEYLNRHKIHPIDFLSPVNCFIPQELAIFNQYNSQMEQKLLRELAFILQNRVCSLGFVSPEHLSKYSSLLKLLENVQNNDSDIHCNQIELALKNGLQLSGLQKLLNSDCLSESYIKVLTCRAAILLYILNIKVQTIFRKSIEETQMNILALLARHYCNEEIDYISEPAIRNCFLLYSDSFLFKKNKMSQLISISEFETKKNILAEYFLRNLSLKKYVEIIQLFNEDLVSECLNRIIEIDQNNQPEMNLFMQNCFYQACSQGKIAVVKALLNCNMPYPDYLSLLQITCANEHMNVLDCLLKNKTQSSNQLKEYCDTLFYFACQKNQLKVIKFLLASTYIDANKPVFGEPPLYKACLNGNIKVVKLLLNQKDIDVNNYGEHRITPLYRACQKGYLGIVQLLLTHEDIAINQVGKNKVSPLVIAIQNGHVDIVRLLLTYEETHKENSYVYGMDMKQTTLLMIACYAINTCGKKSLFKAILQKDNNLFYKNDLGQTALDIAFLQKNNAAIKELLTYAKNKNLFLYELMSAETRYRMVEWASKDSLVNSGNRFFTQGNLSLHLKEYILQVSGDLSLRSR